MGKVWVFTVLLWFFHHIVSIPYLVINWNAIRSLSKIMANQLSSNFDSLSIFQNQVRIHTKNISVTHPKDLRLLDGPRTQLQFLIDTSNPFNGATQNYLTGHSPMGPKHPVNS
jgi:hypothetical protein